MPNKPYKVKKRRTPIKKPATFLAGKVSQQHYDDVVERRFEKRPRIDDGESGNGD